MRKLLVVVLLMVSGTAAGHGFKGWLSANEYFDRHSHDSVYSLFQAMAAEYPGSQIIGKYSGQHFKMYSSREYFEYFKENPIRAHEALEGHVIHINGSISAISEALGGQAVLDISAGKEAMPIRARMAGSEEANAYVRKVSVGDFSVLLCFSDKFSFGMARLKECIPAEAAKARLLNDLVSKVKDPDFQYGLLYAAGSDADIDAYLKEIAHYFVASMYGLENIAECSKEAGRECIKQVLDASISGKAKDWALKEFFRPRSNPAVTRQD